jgi:hypothetical protein
MKIGFLGLLTVLFVALKLIGVIDWSWLLVFIPMIFGVAMAIFFIIVGTIAQIMWGR